jgi:hypothetical protein
MMILFVLGLLITIDFRAVVGHGPMITIPAIAGFPIVLT